MDLGMVNTALTEVAKFINGVRDNVNYVATKSLSDITKLTRVEPLTILSKDLINLEYMVDVNQALLSMFAAYYLQAISVLTTINNVEVVKILDALNPDRDETGFLMGERLNYSKESVRNLVLESYEHSLPGTSRIALEFDKETNTELNTITNLSVGKLLNVRIGFKGTVSEVSGSETVSGDGTKVNGKYVVQNKEWEASNKTTENKEQFVNIPVSVRLMASVIPNATIAHLLALKTEDTGLVERFHAWRSGRISFIKDLIFCQDLIEEHKRALLGDESGTLQEIYRRVTNAKKYGLLTKNPSMVSASNLFVISEQVAREIEHKLGGSLKNSRVRDKAFANTYAMIIAVVDREWERVTFYTRGLASSTDLSVKEIKSVSKNKNGIDIGDLLKSMNMGSPISF